MPVMSSKYAGKCKRCRGAYGVGERIFWSKGTGAVCLACHESTTASTPAPAPYMAPTTPTALTRGPVDFPPDTGGNRHVVRRWESFADYVKSAKSTNPVAGEGCWYSAKTRFYGTDSWDDAVALAEKGWDAVRPQVDALVEKIEAKIAPSLQMAFTSYFDVSGGTVDIGRYLDGEPECMVETRLVEIAKPGRVITLLVNGGVMANASTADIIERGCAIVALVDSLEKMQHAVEIWVEMSCAREFGGTVNRMPVLTHIVKLKGAGEGLDIDSLMFAVANPARHRRLTFALRRNEPDMARFGIPHEATTAVTQKDAIGATMVLESLSYAGKTVLAEEWIMNTLSEFGLVREEGK